VAGDPHKFYQPPVSGCLSELGVQQAEALADALNKTVHFDAIYSSPLGRAIQTAQPLASRQGLEIQVIPWMQEWIPITQLDQDVPDTQFEAIMAAAADIRPEQAWKTPTGEGTFEMAHRIIPPFLKLLESYGVQAAHGGYVFDDDDNDTRIAIFAHGGSLGTLLGYLLGIPFGSPRGVSFLNTGVAAVVFERRVDVWYPRLRIPAPYNGLPA